MSRGSRNLLILGALCLIFATTMTAVSLTIYKATGDIYLDRSRPGFLPDAEEAKKESAASTNYEFSDAGVLDRAELETYLKEFAKIKDKLDDFAAYPESSLSDEALGIVKKSGSSDASEAE